MPDELPAVLTLGEVGDLLRVSPRSVQRMVAAGKLRSLDLGGRLVRFAAADVHSLIAGAPVATGHRSHLTAWHARREAAHAS